MKIAEVVAAAVGLALIACAASASQSWLDRHFLPSFFMPRQWYVLIETAVRVGIVVVGLLLAGPLRRPIARAPTQKPKETLGVVVAALLALFASEWILR